MSSITLALPQEYGYVVLVAASSFLLSFVHGMNVNKFRKRAGVSYPAAYASEELAAKDPKANQFNCAQRAHANYLENQPNFVFALLVSGLKYPVASAVLGVFWLVNRVVFMKGYTDPKKPDGSGRLRGALFWLSQLGLYGTSVAVGVSMLRQ